MFKEASKSGMAMHDAALAWDATPWWHPLRWMRARRRYARAHLAHYGPGSAWDGDRAARPERKR